jgi:adenylosuccinate synthase
MSPPPARRFADRVRLAEAGLTATRLGVARCYLTRHGPGPLVTEDPTLELPEPHNGRNEWQGAFRVGHFDAVALRYALEVSGGVDGIALTHLDLAGRHPLRICDRYEADGQLLGRLPVGPDRDLVRQERLTRLLLRARAVCTAPSRPWPDAVSEALGTPVTLLSCGPTAADKRIPDPALAA